MCGREGGAGELRGERDGRGGLGGWGVSRTDAGSRQQKYENNVRRVVRGEGRFRSKRKSRKKRTATLGRVEPNTNLSVEKVLRE